MKYDPQIHHRRSIRLKDYDYTWAGAYFVTFVVQGRDCLFGEINDDEPKLNTAGEMIAFWWQKLPEKFPSVILDEFVIMPNHFHGIIVIESKNDVDNIWQTDIMERIQNPGQTHGSARMRRSLKWSNGLKL